MLPRYAAMPCHYAATTADFFFFLSPLRRCHVAADIAARRHFRFRSRRC